MVLVLALALSGCSASDEDEKSSDSGAATSAVAYAVMVRAPDTLNDYLVAGDKVPEGQVDLSHARELSGGNFYTTDDAVYYGNFESKTLQRYVVNSKLETELAGEFSLMQYGIDAANEQPLFFSSSSAYYVSSSQGVVIHFDPTRMEILGSTEVPELLRDGYAGWFGGVARVGDRFLATIRYDDAEDYTKTAPDSTLAVAIEDDPEHPLQLLREARVAAASYSFVDDEGNYYALAGDSWMQLTKLQDLPGGSPLVRVRAGRDELDPDYLLDLNELIGTPSVNGIWPLSGSKIVVQAWAHDVDPDVALKTPDDYWTAPHFEWTMVDVANETAEPLQGIARGAAGYALLRMRVDETTYVQQYGFPGGTDIGENVELYAVHDDATTEKVAATSVGDFRFMSRVKTVDGSH